MRDGPFTTGLAVNDSSTGASIVVFGTPYVVDDAYDNAVSGNNADMFKDVITSMTGNVELASSVIPVKDYTLSNITINTLQAVVTGLIIMNFADTDTAYNHRNRCMGNEEKKVDYRQKSV